jgi:hypothetical protein
LRDRKRIMMMHRHVNNRHFHLMSLA